MKQFGKLPVYAFFSVLIFLNGMLCADDYKWDLVNSLVNNDFQKTESIVNSNVNTMSLTEKRLVMSFTLTYSYNENTVRVLNLLLHYNIRPNSFDLYTAINRNQSNSVIYFLLQNGALPNGEILLLAMEKQKFDLAKQFVEADIDIDYQYPGSKIYADGMTPLLYAVKWNNFEMVKLLLEHGADINIKTFNGTTALTMAKDNENVQIFDYLKENGAMEDEFFLPIQDTGILSTQNNPMNYFQTGTYRLSESNKYIILSGNANSGSVNYLDAINNRANDGLYVIGGNNITIAINGSVFIYRIDSNESFSGNGETWTRVRN